MRENRIITVPLNPRTGLFDHDVLRGYLVHRELLRAEPHFFHHDGALQCAVYLESRVLQGAEPPQATANLPPLAHPRGFGSWQAQS
ncbi:MAG: hypothetical protein EXR77_17960 [Myxococcales bacterium]|nr:hypothetical protein [Myxococcales bacterium]